MGAESSNPGPRIPVWLQSLIVLIMVLVPSLLCITAVEHTIDRLEAEPTPFPCILGSAGEDATSNLTGGWMVYFTYPESAANIESMCQIPFRTISVLVRFDMDANEAELQAFIDTMAWEMPPLIPSTRQPAFKNLPLYRSYDLSTEFLDAGSSYVHLWVDTQNEPYGIYVSIVFD